MDGATPTPLYNDISDRRMKDTFSQQWDRVAEPENQARLASALWRIVVGVALTLATGGIAYGVFEYLVPLTSEEAAVAPQSQTLSREELKAAIDKLDARSVRFQELIAD